MESESSLIWSDSIVELHSVSTVDLDVVVIILPFHLEGDDSVRFCDSVQDSVLEIKRV